jgi:hypothetical protein
METDVAEPEPPDNEDEDTTEDETESDDDEDEPRVGAYHPRCRSQRIRDHRGKGRAATRTSKQR